MSKNKNTHTHTHLGGAIGPTLDRDKGRVTANDDGSQTARHNSLLARAGRKSVCVCVCVCVFFLNL